MVWGDFSKKEERPCITMNHNCDQNKVNQSHPLVPLAGGLLIGAIAAGGLVSGILEMKARQVEKQASNYFEWPAISGSKQKSR